MPQRSFRSAIRETLREEMRRDDHLLLIGEDIGGYGGVFKTTEGLQKEFGPLRVRDTPISEQAIVGAAFGAALTGTRVVLEIMFADFMANCMDQIADLVAKYHYMNGGQGSLPLVIRTATGAGMNTGAQHSQNTDSWLMQIPGLMIAVPSTPQDAVGLLRSSIRGSNPVVFYEHKLLYKFTGEVPAEEYTIPFGSAEIRRKGADVTVVATMHMVQKAMAAAEALEKEGIEAEIIDPRTLVPLDTYAIIESVKKTGRLVTIEEAPRTCSWGAEVVSIVAKEALYYMQAPPIRLTGPDTPIPFSPELERLWIPDEVRAVAAIRQMIRES